MIEESKKIEFWNFLTAEKNQARPKGITIQRLAVIKSAILKSEIWSEIIERHGAADRTAQDFYQTANAAAALSRTQFWEAVRDIIRQGEAERQITDGRRNSRNGANAEKEKFPQTIAANGFDEVLTLAGHTSVTVFKIRDFRTFIFVFRNSAAQIQSNRRNVFVINHSSPDSFRGGKSLKGILALFNLYNSNFTETFFSL